MNSCDYIEEERKIEYSYRQVDYGEESYYYNGLSLALKLLNFLIQYGGS